MKRPEVINHKIVNWVEQLACFLKQGDIFRKPRGNTQYQITEMRPDDKVVVCKNLETRKSEQIYFNSPVFRLMSI